MTDYEIDIRSIDPTYNHTLARQAGRDVDSGFEVHLAAVTIELSLQWRPDRTGAERQRKTVAVKFSVDHEHEDVVPASVGDAHSDQQSFSVERLVTALEYAERAMIAYMEDVGPDYTLRSTDSLLAAAGATGDDVVVHNDLEVVDA